MKYFLLKFSQKTHYYIDNILFNMTLKYFDIQ